MRVLTFKAGRSPGRRDTGQKHSPFRPDGSDNPGRWENLSSVTCLHEVEGYGAPLRRVGPMPYANIGNRRSNKVGHLVYICFLLVCKVLKDARSPRARVAQVSYNLHLT